MKTFNGTARYSWEYLGLPKKKERMAGYIRFSDPSTPLDDATMDSQAKAVREYGEKEGYIYDPRHEYREAISAYTVPYMERKTLLEVLDAAKRKEFDVLVTTEVRCISRRTVEVFVIYDLLQKYGVRYETIQEKFEDSATGHLILSARAFSAEVERENTYMRLQRGKKHRLEAGNINGHNKPAYGYVFIDTKREAKAAYALDLTPFYIGEEEWTKVRVVVWIYDRALEGWSIRKIAFTLTEMGIPVPDAKLTRKGQAPSNVWHPSTVHAILTSHIYTGEVIANRYKNIENATTKKRFMQKRPETDWVYLPEGIAPPIVTVEVFEAVQKQLAVNKQDALRRTDPDTPKEDLGILRAGYCKCGICGRTMSVNRRSFSDGSTQPQYRCKYRMGSQDIAYNHITSISVPLLDKAAAEKIREIVNDPAQVRERVAERRAAPKVVVDTADVEATIANIQTEIGNLFELARHATNDSTRMRLGLLMEDLERQQQEAEAMLIDIDESAEDAQKLEDEIVKFETWAEAVRPELGNPDYKPAYEELRLAVRILGLVAVVYPLHGDHPFRAQIDTYPPEIMKHLGVLRSNTKFDCLPPGKAGTQGACR
jgi:DNA invertase Pin-like site-specific DNA recombinase